MINLNRHWTVNFLNFFLLKICIDCVQPVQILTYLPIIFFLPFLFEFIMAHIQVIMY